MTKTRENIMKLPQKEEILRVAFATALHYHPIDMRNLAKKVLSGQKLQDRISLPGDTFAGVYNNILRFPPDDYEIWILFFFEN